MKKIRLRTFVVFGFAALSGTVLLQTSQSVQKAEEKLLILEAEVEKEQEAVQVLHAEWEYLNSPERLEKLANEYLDLVPPRVEQMTTDLSTLQEQGTSGDAQPLMQNVSTDAPAQEPSPAPVKTEAAPVIKKKAPSDRDFGALLKKLDNGGTR